MLKLSAINQSVKISNLLSHEPGVERVKMLISQKRPDNYLFGMKLLEEGPNVL